MHNPFKLAPKSDAARPSLRERATSLKATAARVIRRSPKGALPEPQTDRLSRAAVPALVSMVAEWERLLHLENYGGLSDEEADPIMDARLALHVQICAFPIASSVDLLAKLPLYRDEMRNVAPRGDEKPTMDYETWRCVVRDLDKAGAGFNVVEGREARPARAGTIDGSGLITYEDAAGNVRRTPIAEWVEHMAQRLYSVALVEVSRAFDAACRDEPDQDANALHDRLRKELRIDALHDLTHRSDKTFALCREYAVGHRWRAVGNNADAELLALGREFDVRHAEWVIAARAQAEAEAKVHAIFRDLQGRRGWSTMEAHEVSWGIPGVNEAVSRGDAATGAMDQVLRSIIAAPARTLDGLAVKARAIIPSVWCRGHYEEDAALGDDEDWTEQNVRSLVDECLHLAGVDWTGRRWRPEPMEAAAPTDTPPAVGVALAARASAEAINLSSLGIYELTALYETLNSAREAWSGALEIPLAVMPGKQGFMTHTAFGKLADFEDTRFAILRDRVVKEAEGRTATSDDERNDLLAMRIHHEIACEGRIRAPALIADIAQAWG